MLYENVFALHESQSLAAKLYKNVPFFRKNQVLRAVRLRPAEFYLIRNRKGGETFCVKTVLYDIF